MFITVHCPGCANKIMSAESQTTLLFITIFYHYKLRHLDSFKRPNELLSSTGSDALCILLMNSGRNLCSLSPAQPQCNDRILGCRCSCVALAVCIRACMLSECGVCSPISTAHQVRRHIALDTHSTILGATELNQFVF